jgi:hypothetical protein
VVSSETTVLSVPGTGTAGDMDATLLLEIVFIPITMPICCTGVHCLFPNLPLEGRHYCAICKKDLHGICGIFNGDDMATTYRNRCFLCPPPTGGIVTTPTAPQQDNHAFTQQSAINGYRSW